jgi:peptide/nickel transport system permease protein
MWLYILKRLMLMFPMLLGITLVSFVVIHLAPGTPVEMQTTLNPKASLEAQKRLQELYGLDKPLMVQYGDWLKRLAVLDFGRSFSPDRRPVWDKIKERVGITIGLNLASLIIILLVAIPIGVLAAVHPHSFFDRATPFWCSSALPCPPSGWPCCSSCFSGSTWTGCPSPG